MGAVVGRVYSAYFLNCFSASSLGTVGSRVHSVESNFARGYVYKASKENVFVVETTSAANLGHIVVLRQQVKLLVPLLITLCFLPPLYP